MGRVGRHDLQLNLYDLISCSCWDTLVLHVGMQLFLGESDRRVDCVASSSGCHLAFCCLLYGGKLGGACMGMRLQRLYVAEGLQQGITCSIVPRPSHSQCFDHLQHGEGLGDFHMIDMNW